MTATATVTETCQPTADCPRPEVRGGVVPYLNLDGAARAADFYVAAFGAIEAGRMPPDPQGRSMHIHLYVNGGSLMLSDPFPEHGCPAVPQQGYSLVLRVDDADALFARAVAAGATPVMPVQDMFWGDRYGQLRDPFGVLWALNQPKR